MRPHFYSSEQTHGQKFGDSRVQACTGRRDDPRLICCSRSTNDGNYAIVDHHKHRDEPTISAWTAPPIKSWSGMAAVVGGNRCRNFPEDHRHSVAGSSGRVSTRFRKWSGLRQSPQVTYDRSCGSPIRKAGVNLVHHDRRRQFPNGAPSRRGTDPHRFPQPREARRVLDQRRCARVQPGRRTFQLKPHSFRPRCDPQARERLTRPLEARPDFTFCAGGDWAAWLES